MRVVNIFREKMNEQTKWNERTKSINLNVDFIIIIYHAQ